MIDPLRADLKWVKRLFNFRTRRTREDDKPAYGALIRQARELGPQAANSHVAAERTEDTGHAAACYLYKCLAGERDLDGWLVVNECAPLATAVWGK